MSERMAPSGTSWASRLLAFAAVAVALAAGVLVFGRISDDATVAMGTTAAWFGIVFLVAAGLAWRRRGLLWPLAGGYALVAVATAVFVIAPTLFDKEVNERVVTGRPVSDARDRDPAPTGNVQVAQGSFRSIAHEGTGTAAVVELPGGERKLTLTEFETDAGPDLRLYVSTGDPAGGDLGEFEDLGALKGNVGNQQYTLPRGLNLGRHSTVVVWCRAFSVAFTSARLERS
jgi:Electron transfer DM13